MSAGAPLPFKISVLVFMHDEAGRLLLIQRTKAPNIGCWSPIGGKLEMATGESPFECAVRETEEETGAKVTTNDLHLFGMISEKGYEGQSHWLMFLFDCRKNWTVPPSRRPTAPCSGPSTTNTVAASWPIAPNATRASRSR